MMSIGVVRENVDGGGSDDDLMMLLIVDGDVNGGDWC